MKVQKVINWVSASGAKVEITVEVSKSVENEVAYADGANIEIGTETNESKTITIIANGKTVVSSYGDPQISTRPEQIKLGYAHIGKVYFDQAKYEMIMGEVAAAELEATDEVFTATKNVEKQVEKQIETELVAKEELADAEYAKQIKNGLCPKCGTYCYGDC